MPSRLDAAALQIEVDAIETSLGAGVNTNGTFNGAVFEGAGPLAGVTSFTNAITQLANYATANDTLSEMNDVQIGGPAGGTAPADGQYLKFVGSSWVADTLTLSDVTDVTATAAEVNLALDGITASAAYTVAEELKMRFFTFVCCMQRNKLVIPLTLLS